MLDELAASLQLAASLVVNRSVGASAFERPSAPPTTSLGVQALLVDARSPLTMVHLSFADAEASGVEAVGPLDVEVGDAAQVGSEAAPVMDICHSGTDVCASGKTTSATVWAGGSPPLAPDPAMSVVPVAALSIVESLEERLCLPLQMPLIHGPPRLRRPRTPAPVTSLRRSVRIAAQPREADSTKQAQRVLIQKLGFEAPTPNVGSDTVRKYKAAFREPLLDSTYDTL
jgi:hypothetical protein